MSEFDLIGRLRASLDAAGATPAAPDVGIGDDTAVLAWPGGGTLQLLVCADAVVEGVHADLGLTSLADLGWKALTTNLSDVAAMGGSPTAAVVTVAVPVGVDVEALYEGLGEAAARYGCPVVGGDTVAGVQLVVSVAVTGVVDGGAVLRSGARPGDGIWVTGPLGGAAAGLRLLRAGGPVPAPLRAAHARPVPRLAEGRAARQAGATAMIDVSDGFTADLAHILEASGVGADLDGVPVAEGATLDEALGGGDDYELVVTAPPGVTVAGAHPVGRISRQRGLMTLGGTPIHPAGWDHRASRPI